MPSETPLRADPATLAGAYRATPAIEALGPCRLVLAPPARLPEGLDHAGREVSGLAMADPNCPEMLAEAALWTLNETHDRLSLVDMAGGGVVELVALAPGVWTGRMAGLGVLRLERDE